jgi:ubiquinone/menaquinone biosynthesis C-methylase UbiE
MSQKPIGTREWYDFVGQLAGALPAVHLGGLVATRELLEQCELGPTSEVLDVGCGPGVTACMIAQEYGSSVMGFDLSEVMIAAANDKAKQLNLTDKVTFRVADVFEMPFEDGSFDVALAESVFTPLPGDKGQALAEMVRVIRPGGRIAINESTFDPATPADIVALFEQHPAFHGYFTPQSLRGLFEDAGLQVIYMQETRQVQAPSVTKQIGVRGLLSFMFRAYPKILLKLLRDPRLRKVSRIDDQVTKRGKPYMGYTLIVGQK